MTVVHVIDKDPSKIDNNKVAALFFRLDVDDTGDLSHSEVVRGLTVITEDKVNVESLLEEQKLKQPSYDFKSFSKVVTKCDKQLQLNYDEILSSFKTQEFYAVSFAGIIHFLLAHACVLPIFLGRPLWTAVFPYTYAFLVFFYCIYLRVKERRELERLRKLYSFPVSNVRTSSYLFLQNIAYIFSTTVTLIYNMETGNYPFHKLTSEVMLPIGTVFFCYLGFSILLLWKLTPHAYIARQRDCQMLASLPLTSDSDESIKTAFDLLQAIEEVTAKEYQESFMYQLIYNRAYLPLWSLVLLIPSVLVVIILPVFNYVTNSCRFCEFGTNHTEALRTVILGVGAPAIVLSFSTIQKHIWTNSYLCFKRGATIMSIFASITDPQLSISRNVPYIRLDNVRNLVSWLRLRNYLREYVLGLELGSSASGAGGILVCNIILIPLLVVNVIMNGGFRAFFLLLSFIIITCSLIFGILVTVSDINQSLDSCFQALAKTQTSLALRLISAQSEEERAKYEYTSSFISELRTIFTDFADPVTLLGFEVSPSFIKILVGYLITAAISIIAKLVFDM
eukprot:GILI01014208.1.p1 GENE.GILI01014208.1~~GILI01014208.1.p1  ORF type:complete len:597 (+),score=89.21 GILI01014208.1:101-1792(+)